MKSRKQLLYENIMMVVAKEVKKAIIENKDNINEGRLGKALAGLGLAATLTTMPSCNYHSSLKSDPFETEYRTTTENRDYVWDYHYDNGDWEDIEDGVGFCYWCGTRCAKNGGGWTVCVVFKDKSYGDFILPAGSKRPNAQCKDNEYTTDRIDTRNLTQISVTNYTVF